MNSLMSCCLSLCSFTIHCWPKKFYQYIKSTHCFTLLKKQGLDPDNISNQIMANLTFLSKLIQNVVAWWMVCYPEVSDLMPKYSFASGMDILWRWFCLNWSRTPVTPLTLDVSCCLFSMIKCSIQHSQLWYIVIKCLNTSYRISDQPLDLFKSFLRTVKDAGDNELRLLAWTPADLRAQYSDHCTLLT